LPNTLTKNNKSKNGWKQNPEAVKQDILRAAMRLFAENGLSGSRIDEIAALTKTSKRMIYYYFGDKEGLYSQALEAAYSRVRAGEERLDLAGLPPLEALDKLVSFTFDHHRKHPDFIRMVMIENIHNADYLKRSEMIRKLNLTAIDRLHRIIERGEREKAFREGLDPVALHWKISALSFFNVSNKPTFSTLFGSKLFSARGQQDLRQEVVDMVLYYVRKERE
jgi:AcrR family transcriptional regulator